MLIKDFMAMLNTFGGVNCAIVNSENYTLLSGGGADEKRGVLFDGWSSNIPIDLLRKRFTKWEMFGNCIIFVCQ